MDVNVKIVSEVAVTIEFVEITPRYLDCASKTF